MALSCNCNVCRVDCFRLEIVLKPELFRAVTVGFRSALDSNSNVFSFHRGFTVLFSQAAMSSHSVAVDFRSALLSKCGPSCSVETCVGFCFVWRFRLVVSILLSLRSASVSCSVTVGIRAALSSKDNVSRSMRVVSRPVRVLPFKCPTLLCCFILRCSLALLRSHP